MTARGWLLLASVTTLWGGQFFLIKVVLSELTPASIVLLRTGIAAAVLAPLFLTQREGVSARAHWRALVALALTEAAVPWYFLAEAERHISSSVSALLIAGVPLVGALLAWLTPEEERLDVCRIAGLITGLAGVALVVGLDVPPGEIGALGAIAIVVLCFAAGPIVIVRYLRSLTVISLVTATVTMTALAYAPIGIAQLPASVSPSVMLAIAALGIGSTALAFVLFFALVGQVGPIRANLTTYLNPAVALLLGVLILGERLTAGVAVGFVLIASGSYLASRSQAPLHPSSRT